MTHVAARPVAFLDSFVAGRNGSRGGERERDLGHPSLTNTCISGSIHSVWGHYKEDERATMIQTCPT